MKNKEVWIVFTKSKPLEGCSIDFDGCDFYFSEIYVPVVHDGHEMTSLEGIVNRAKDLLLEDRLMLSDVSKCFRYHKEHWGVNTEMNKAVHVNAARALSSNQVEVGEFRTEEIEALIEYRHSQKDMDE